MANKTDELVDFGYQEWKKHLDVMITVKPGWVNVLFIVVMVVTFVLSVCGNLLTCVVIYCDKRMHTAINYYLFNLAVVDLLVAFSGILLDLDGFINYPFDFNGLGELVCKVHHFFVATLWNTDVLTITVLAIERYIAIFHPMLLNKKPAQKRVAKIICLIWFIAMLETLPETWTVELIRSSRFSICCFVPTRFTKLISGILCLVTFIIPLGIMVFVYTMVAFKVKSAQSSYSRAEIFNHRNNSSKVNKLTAAMTVSFVVCWLPFFAIRIVFAVELYRYWAIQYWDLMMLLTSFSSRFSIVLNPLLFSLISTKFRRALKNLWNTKIKRHRASRSLIV
ncbi:hypothetical protein ABMA28_001944 [Loxostege sticticalis]|uniref:G-protein coupled receptors family 1 profile domain-containing protein n=1 Tax=Loxostege sticticalis TaxID=481309 RepID=A0ABD0SZ83_LOXSC